MNKFYILLTSFLVISCQQDVDDQSAQKQKDLPSLISQTDFDCDDYKDSLKEVNVTIQAVQNIRIINEKEKNAIDYYQKYMNANPLMRFSRELEGKAPETSGNYVLTQKIPGKIQGTCLAEAFLTDGSNENIVFTVSEVDDSNFIAIQQASELKSAIMLYELAEQENMQKQAQSQELVKAQDVTSKTNPSNTDSDENLVSQEVVPEVQKNKDIKASPSFNCEKAETSVEKMICNNSELAQLDVSLANAYRQETEPSRDASYIETIKKEQKEWLKERNMCETTECLKQKLLRRYESLAPWDFEQHE